MAGKTSEMKYKLGTKTKGLHVVEICTNREENLKLHRELWAKTMDVITDIFAR